MNKFDRYVRETVNTEVPIVPMAVVFGTFYVIYSYFHYVPAFVIGAFVGSIGMFLFISYSITLKLVSYGEDLTNSPTLSAILPLLQGKLFKLFLKSLFGMTAGGFPPRQNNSPSPSKPNPFPPSPTAAPFDMNDFDAAAVKCRDSETPIVGSNKESE